MSGCDLYFGDQGRKWTQHVRTFESSFFHVWHNSTIMERDFHFWTANWIEDHVFCYACLISTYIIYVKKRWTFTHTIEHILNWWINTYKHKYVYKEKYFKWNWKTGNEHDMHRKRNVRTWLGTSRTWPARDTPDTDMRTLHRRHAAGTIPILMFESFTACFTTE